MNLDSLKREGGYYDLLADACLEANGCMDPAALSQAPFDRPQSFVRFFSAASAARRVLNAHLDERKAAGRSLAPLPLARKQAIASPLYRHYDYWTSNANRAGNERCLRIRNAALTDRGLTNQVT